MSGRRHIGGRFLAPFLALRGLRKRPLRALLTTSGIVLGVGMVVGVLALSATLLDGFRGLFDTVYGRTDLIVSRSAGSGGGGAYLGFDEAVVARVRRTPGVDARATSGSVGGPAYLVDDEGEVREGASSQISLGGFEPGKVMEVAEAEVVAGREPERSGDFTVEEGWARDQGLDLGDTMRIAASGGVRTVRITGIFRFARPVDFGGTGFAAETLADAQRDLGLEGLVTQVNVRAADRAEVAALRDRLQGVLGEDYAVRTPSGEVEEISEQLSGLRTFLLFFAGVALFVGAFLIFNAFNVTVLQRTREIGMLRTLGATRTTVLRQVLAEAAVMGVAGSALGLAAGVGLAIGLIALMGQVFVGLPFGSLRVPASALVAGVLVGTLVTALAALWPAVRAARTSPLEAMRRRAERRSRPPWRLAVVGAGVLAASIPGVWGLTRADRPGWLTVYGVAGVIGVFLGVALIAPLVVRPLVAALAVPLTAIGRLEARLASDNARRVPGRTALTASAVMIGLSLVVVFASFSSSAVSAVREGIDRSLKADFVIGPRNLFSFVGFSPELAERVAALPEARAASPVRFGFAKVDGEAAQVLGVGPDTFGEVNADRLEDGGAVDWRLLAEPAAIVTSGYRAETGTGAGDTVAIARASGGPPLRLPVVAVIDQGDTHVYVSDALAARELGISQVYYVYVAAADDPQSRAALGAALERVVDDFPTAKVFSNEELKAEVEKAFDQVFGLLYALLGVAIIASALGIGNTMAMSVIERTREIGLIRAVGGTRRQVRAMIRRESVLVTLVGLILGLAVGLALGWAFVRASATQFPGLTFVVPWGTLGIVVAGAVVVGVVAAVLPGRRAARLNVIEAVGYE